MRGDGEYKIYKKYNFFVLNTVSLVEFVIGGGNKMEMASKNK